MCWTVADFCHCFIRTTTTTTNSSNSSNSSGSVVIIVVIVFDIGSNFIYYCY